MRVFVWASSLPGASMAVLSLSSPAPASSICVSVIFFRLAPLVCSDHLSFLSSVTFLFFFVSSTSFAACSLLFFHVWFVFSGPINGFDVLLNSSSVSVKWFLVVKCGSFKTSYGGCPAQFFFSLLLVLRFVFIFFSYAWSPRYWFQSSSSASPTPILASYVSVIFILISVSNFNLSIICLSHHLHQPPQLQP